MDNEKCPECSAYQGHHHPKCSLIDGEHAKTLLHQYYDNWLEARNKRDGALKHWRDLVTFWQGKCAILRQENNALRRKVSRQIRSDDKIILTPEDFPSA